MMWSRLTKPHLTLDECVRFFALDGGETPAPVELPPIAIDAPTPSADEMAAQMAAAHANDDAPPSEPEAEDDPPAGQADAEGDADDGTTNTEEADEPAAAAEPPPALVEELETAKAERDFYETRTAELEAHVQEWHTSASAVAAENDRLTALVEQYEAGLRSLGFELDPTVSKLRELEAENARLKAPAPTVKDALAKDRASALAAEKMKAAETRFAQAQKALTGEVQKLFPQLKTQARFDALINAYAPAVVGLPIDKRPSLLDFAKDFMGKAQVAAAQAQRAANAQAPKPLAARKPGSPRAVNAGIPSVDEMAAGLRAAGFAGF